VPTSSQAVVWQKTAGRASRSVTPTPPETSTSLAHARPGRCACPVGGGAFLALLLSACAPDSTQPPAGTSNTGSAKDTDAPTWVVSAAVAGDAPPVDGRSLFDFVVTNMQGGTGVQAVPWPFTALMARLEEALGDDDSKAIAGVLIPIGRSLQRNAANPHFFDSPRVVIAVVGDGADRPGESGMLLKDRLYIGYQERAATMEVISYNEAAGRFEFEIVSDYREGGTAELRYVDRENCVPCHQNHAPIFSRPPWDETNANAAVAARLRAVQDHFHGVAVDSGIDVPNAIDDATDRANLLAAWQRIWTEACELDTPDASLACRADALVAALRFRLSGSRHPGAGADAERSSLVSALQEHWPRMWPQGLAVPDADIPNRELPLRRQSADLMDLPAALLADRNLTTAETVAIARVPMQLEPFQPRPPRDVWREVNGALVDAFVSGLASFFAPVDVQRLDQHLFAHRPLEKLGAGHAMRCELTSTPTRDAARDLAVTCRDPGMPLDGRARPGLEASLSVAGASQLVTGTVQRIEVPGIGVMHDLSIVPSELRREGGRVHALLELRAASTGLHARLTDGNALEPIELSWDEGAANALHGDVLIDASNDFAPITAAVGTLVADTASGASDALTARPFRRAVLLRPLFERLDMEPVLWCCLDTRGMPPAVRGDIVVPPLGSEQGQSEH